MFQKSWDGGAEMKKQEIRAKAKALQLKKHFWIIQGRIDSDNPKGWGEFWLFRDGEGLWWSTAMFFSRRLLETSEKRYGVILLMPYAIRQFIA
jgi:hypothetical protein